MKIAFTICSNNYLSQARVLADSLSKYNPGYKFVIGLCDRMNELVDYSPFEPYEIIEVEKLNIDNFEWMVQNYNIIELNTSVKPSYFLHLISRYKDVETIMYFDPDIEVFDNLTMIEKELEGKTALLTPHILSPMPDDGKKPEINTFLNYGIYNLGFLAIRPCEEADKLLNWWKQWLSTKSYDNVANGLFVDQLPMTLAPLFFEQVCVSHTSGYNFAYWNFHERMIGIKENKYYINSDCPLVFFHFSSFNPSPPLSISRHQDRYSLEDNPHLKDLYTLYAQKLISSKYFELKEVPCYYVELRKKRLEEERIEALKNEPLRRKIRRRIKKIFK